MANPTRILFISGEVTPFAKSTDLADLVRSLPEKLTETGEFESRIMMPRYGVISERRNRLHEVIRLSGSDVHMGAEKETLKVKVASIPGIRLQVYFMDNNKYFKRKGVLGDRPGKVFEDNPQRALFFARAALQTIRNLGWSPDVVHAFGWMSALIPVLLRTECADETLFQNSRVVYTPSDIEVASTFTSAMLKTLGMDDCAHMEGKDFNQMAVSHADAVIYPPFVTPAAPDQEQFSSDAEEMVRQAAGIYEQVLNTVAA